MKWIFKWAENTKYWWECSECWTQDWFSYSVNPNTQQVNCIHCGARPE